MEMYSVMLCRAAGGSSAEFSGFYGIEYSATAEDGSFIRQRAAPYPIKLSPFCKILLAIESQITLDAATINQ
jgi:hypothetical protein